MDGIHQTLLRPANNIAQDYLKFLEDSMLFERMQKKIGRDFASTSFSQYLCHSICDGARGSKPGGSCPRVPSNRKIVWVEEKLKVQYKTVRYISQQTRPTQPHILLRVDK